MLFDCYFDKRKNITVKKQILFLTVLALVEAGLKNQFNHTVINLLSTTGTTFLLCFIFYRGKFEVQLLLSFLILLLNMILDVLSILPVIALLNLNMEMKGIKSLVVILTAVPFSLGKLIVINMIRRKRMKTVNAGDRYSYYQQIVIPAFSISYAIYYVYDEVSSSPGQLVKCYITIFFLALVNILHYIIFENKEKLYLQNYNNMLLQQKYEYREEYYKNLEKYQEEIRIIKHDLKNQLIRISAYEASEAKKEIERIIDNLVKKDETHFTRNAGINSLLSVKYNNAVKKGIDCNFSVLIPEKMGINESDLAGLIGNIIDNAVEAAEKCWKDQWIKFNITYYNHLLIIVCENSTEGPVEYLKTTKKNVNEHGLGIKSIYQIVERYHGTCKYVARENSLLLEVNLWSQG
jgi:hypothetical protein